MCDGEVGIETLLQVLTRDLRVAYAVVDGSGTVRQVGGVTALLAEGAQATGLIGQSITTAIPELIGSEDALVAIS